ncbi:hypothetical protein [Duganella radicis]|uniref:Uncharacterized protein n=1 Tax=Duganella radicis TaxID=551988 RepID=A0A6L6PPH3_9BURK|nr:hypothetical protein [Duganella radicis]MTV40659.1 hypothetical protein [Duganella radicis]
MKDGFALLAAGCIFAVLAWASWHWWSEDISFGVLVILLLGYAVDNYQLRWQVQRLLAEREKNGRD